jgi:ectoine hydroxylase-related dioxygenase (phytanoyl-CoA dioxygenase family)
MQKLFSVDVNAYLAAARHLSKLLSIQDLLLHENIRAFIKNLGLSLPSVPTSPVVSIMSERLKIAGGYFGLAPHQDWPSMQGSLDAVIVWAPLMDVTAASFPLQVIPRSHAQGLWGGVNTASAREIDPRLYGEEDFMPFELRRGDVVFMTTFTVHRTGVMHGVNECSGLRIACNTRIENSAEATFVKRQFPCAYKRTVERELITKDFPSQMQVKKALCA